MNTTTQELLTKLAGKLNGALDLFTFENTQMALDYVVKQFLYNSLISCGISIVVFIISAKILIKIIDTGENKLKDDDYADIAAEIVASVIVGTVVLCALIFSLVELGSALRWWLCPMVQIIEYLR